MSRDERMKPTSARTNRQILLAQRPDGRLEARHFRSVVGTVGEPGPGEVLC